VGDSLKREFSLTGIDTGKTMPPAPGAPEGPGTPVMRPSFLSAFLANLGPALAGGLASEPGAPFGTGLGGALQGVQSYNEKQFQRGLQIQAAQRQQAQQASTAALQAAQTSQLNQITPLELQQKQLEVQRQQGLVGLSNNQAGIDQLVSPMSASLTNLTPDEQAQLDAAKTAVQMNLKQGKFDVGPYNAAVAKISQDRITTARGAEATPFKDWKAQFVKEKGRQPSSKEIQDFQNSGMQMRITGMENLRQDNYLDTSTNSVETKTAGEFAQDNKINPGRFIKYSGQVANAMKGQSLISDIRDGVKQMKAAVDDPKFQLSSGARALMSIASKSPENALSAVTSGLAAQHLSDAEQNYVIAHATLLERAMSLRGLQGQGAGSDQQRRAIADMLPGLATGDKGMAQKQLKTLENNIDNVAKAIPKLGKQAPAVNNDLQIVRDKSGRIVGVK
jgi:hypothetical protein